MLANIKRVSLGKRKKNDTFVENDRFPKIGEYPLNITRMLNILHIPVCSYAKIKCNIVTYKLNVYRTYAKQP